MRHWLRGDGRTMRTVPTSRSGVRGGLAAIVIAIGLAVGACSGGEAADFESALETPCFTTGPELVLPEDWIAADVSTGPDECLFVLQAEGRADTTVIAGELYLSSAGRSFDEFVSQVEEGLTVGQEPDLLALQILNTGATGRTLPVVERIEFEEPNRAVVLIHESDRRDGFMALSAVVDVPTESNPAVTHAILLWGLLLPPVIDDYQQSVNYPLITDLINSMRIPPR